MLLASGTQSGQRDRIVQPRPEAQRNEDFQNDFRNGLSARQVLACICSEVSDDDGRDAWCEILERPERMVRDVGPLQS